MAQARLNSYAACICFETPVLEQQNMWWCEYLAFLVQGTKHRERPFGPGKDHFGSLLSKRNKKT